jgi:hypothetical protein
LLDLFEITQTEYSGVDNKVVRIQTRAIKEGYLEPSFFDLGILVKASKKHIRNELKRKGFISERNVDIQLRVGDMFIIYITRSKKLK